jgi:hypothetical protein
MGMFATDDEAATYIYGRFKQILEESPEGFYIDTGSIGGATPEALSTVEAHLMRDGYRVFVDKNDPAILHVKRAGIVETLMRVLKEGLAGDR